MQKQFRRSGVSVGLLKGVIEYARLNGIKIIEAYPTIPTKEKLPDSFLWVGLYKSFEKAGFEIVDTNFQKQSDCKILCQINNKLIFYSDEKFTDPDPVILGTEYLWTELQACMGID